MCCWACVPCKKHEYMVSYKECADCGAGKWPHENRTSCYELPAKVSDTHSFLITLIYHHHVLEPSLRYPPIVKVQVFGEGPSSTLFKALSEYLNFTIQIDIRLRNLKVSTNHMKGVSLTGH